MILRCHCGFWETITGIFQGWLRVVSLWRATMFIWTRIKDEEYVSALMRKWFGLDARLVKSRHMRVIPAVALINIAALEAVSPPQNEIRELLKVCVCLKWFLIMRIRPRAEKYYTSKSLLTRNPWWISPKIIIIIIKNIKAFFYTLF